jgi:hypothetical protein
MTSKIPLTRILNGIFAAHKITCQTALVINMTPIGVCRKAPIPLDNFRIILPDSKAESGNMATDIEFAILGELQVSHHLFHLYAIWMNDPIIIHPNSVSVEINLCYFYSTLDL